MSDYKKLVILKSVGAMKIIVEEAIKVVAAKFNTTAEKVEEARMAGNENVAEMLGKLIACGVSEASELVK